MCALLMLHRVSGRVLHMPAHSATHLPHGVGVFSRLDARGVDGAVGLMSHVKHHDGPVMAAYGQQGVVDWVEVEAHHLFFEGNAPATEGTGQHNVRA